MKRYEREAFIKSYLLFFLLLGAIYLSVVYGNYRDRSRELDEKIFSQMRIFSFHPAQGEFGVDFVPRTTKEERERILRGSDGLYALFPIPGSRKFLLKVILPREAYDKRLSRVLHESFKGWGYILALIVVVSWLLALYTLRPLTRALELNEEFVKDILHDLNTPLSALRINLHLLKKGQGGERALERMLYSLDTIESFQSNLRAFLERECGRKERFELREILEGRLGYFRQIYPGIEYRMEIDVSVRLECNREALGRIVENLLSNAGRYNRPGGRVTVRYRDNKLEIEDTGIGIRDPEKVFDRFYKEGERGLGLGLHIVKKLSDALGITVSLHSAPGRGTLVILDLERVMAG